MHTYKHIHKHTYTFTRAHMPRTHAMLATDNDQLSWVPTHTIVSKILEGLTIILWMFYVNWRSRRALFHETHKRLLDLSCIHLLPWSLRLFWHTCSIPLAPFRSLWRHQTSRSVCVFDAGGKVSSLITVILYVFFHVMSNNAWLQIVDSKWRQHATWN